MKPVPISSHVYEHFYAARLYRDDLERIIGLMRSSSLIVRISDESLEYESLDELMKARGAQPRKFLIEGSLNQSPFASAEVSRSDSSWSLTVRGKEYAGLAREIEQIFRKRRSWLESVSFFPLFVVANALALFGSYWRGGGTTAAVLEWTGFAGILLVAACGVYWRMYGRAVLAFQHEAGFFARNKNQIGLLAVGALIGALIASAPKILAHIIGGSAPAP